MLEWLTPTHVLSVLGGTAAGAVAVKQIYKHMIKPVFVFFSKVSTMYDKVEALVAQFERNGGSSVRDALDRIEAAMLVQDSRQKVMLGLVPFAVVETDATGRVVFVNRTYRMWTGLSDMEAWGEGWVNALHPDDRDKVKDGWEDAVEEKRLWEGRFRMLDGRGGHYDAFARAYPMRDPQGELGNGEPSGWLAVIYKCAADVCCTNPDMCLYATTTGVCRAGDHTPGSELKPAKFQSLNQPTRRQ